MEKVKFWILASRPKTLFAAVSPVLIGTAFAIHYGKWNISFSIAALSVALLIQIGTNFVNDLYDFLKGSDSEIRIGPTRMVASGKITTHEMKIAIISVFTFAFVIGLYIVINTNYLVLLVGILSIFFGVIYTAGPYPLAYNGLGELFVLFLWCSGNLWNILYSNINNYFRMYTLLLLQ